ncbi:hypothetical protein BDD43_3188 [Mucilaginibacter gracilis]|uniref:Uncharacterized protein n=1 Tax=Mucilaginibacter gracilis TaxID=423350 RepID=A0A495J3P3_9SPHI|nr:hypothetical protein [Mucilaginibacter gracilis]RKR82988.1 hypothetical protein BDD43_3188 [Mucilaginibacter gracilis]
MLSDEVTIGIYPNDELNNILIVPEGAEYHLFLTRAGHSVLTHASNLGSIVFTSDSWAYQGTLLSAQSQKEVADYIINYPG